MNDTGIILLAAGASSRLGKPKQLLPFGDQLLVQCVADEAIQAKPCAVVVVTGASATEVAAAVSSKNVSTVFNSDWQQGMASGIAAGLTRLCALHRSLARVILLVCDQPFITKEILTSLVAVQGETAKGIVACTYAGTLGTPVLFDSSYFKELVTLTGTDGAKSLLQRFKHDVATLPFPAGGIDIDTEEDYQHLMANFEKKLPAGQ